MTRDDDTSDAPSSPRSTQRGWSGSHTPGARQGTVIAERYRIGRLLGRGGMGEVYEAEHLVIGRRFAIKFVRNDLKLDERILQRFRREAQAAGRLEHENIAAVFDLGSTLDGDPFIVLECLDGEDLAEMLSKGLPAPPVVAGLVRQAALGLHAAHESNIVHRDLKPANLFVCRIPNGGSRIKLLDFGIAKLQVAGVQESLGGWMPTGTPQYMSPEQAAGRSQADRRMDVYSLGAIMYEALSGRRPHAGDDYHAVLRNIMNRTPASLATMRSDLPLGLIEIVERAMSRDPQARFDTALDMAQALRPFSAAGLVGAQPAPALAAGAAIAAGPASYPPPASGLALSGPVTRATEYTNAGEQSLRSRPPASRRWPTWMGMAVGATAGALIVVVLAGVLRRAEPVQAPPVPVAAPAPAVAAPPVPAAAPAPPTGTAPAAHHGAVPTTDTPEGAPLAVANPAQQAQSTADAGALQPPPPASAKKPHRPRDRGRATPSSAADTSSDNDGVIRPTKL